MKKDSDKYAPDSHSNYFSRRKVIVTTRLSHGKRKPCVSCVVVKMHLLQKKSNPQECIPVGCVPAAHWPYGGGVPPSWGEGVPPSLGGCLLLGGGGVCGIPACTEADPPPVNRMTNRCKNITLATTLLQPVKITYLNFYRPQRSCGQGNIFTSMCQEFCPQGGGSASVHDGIPPPPPPWPDTPPEQTPPRTDPPRTDTPQTRHPPE